MQLSRFLFLISYSPDDKLFHELLAISFVCFFFVFDSLAKHPCVTYALCKESSRKTHVDYVKITNC